MLVTEETLEDCADRLGIDPDIIELIEPGTHVYFTEFTPLGLNNKPTRYGICNDGVVVEDNKDAGTHEREEHHCVAVAPTVFVLVAAKRDRPARSVDNGALQAEPVRVCIANGTPVADVELVFAENGVFTDAFA